MKIVRVHYTTTKEYAATNKRNIQKVTEELNKINHKGIIYSTYILPDGKTFMHFDQFENEEAHQFLQSLESFKIFSEGLLKSGLEVEPSLSLLSLVSSTNKFF